MQSKFKKLNIQIGVRLRELRIKSGYTQENFAEALNISVEHYQKLEHGAYGLSPDKMYVLYQKYNIDTTYLITGQRSSLTNPLPFLVNCSDEEYNHILEQILLYLKNILRRHS